MEATLDSRTARVFLLFQKIQSIDIELLSVTDQNKMKSLITSRDLLWMEKCAITDAHFKVSAPPKTITTIQTPVTIGAVAKLHASTTLLTKRVHDLEVEITKLKSEMKLSRSLLEIGIAVRKRFYEQTKWKLLKQASNKEIVDAGNIAAHQPNLIADISLLLLRPHLKSAYISTLKATFPAEFDDEGNLPSLDALDWNDKIAEISNIRAMGRVECLDIPKGQLDLMERTVMEILKTKFGGKCYGGLDSMERQAFMSDTRLDLVLKQTRVVLDTCINLRKRQR